MFALVENDLALAKILEFELDLWPLGWLGLTVEPVFEVEMELQLDIDNRLCLFLFLDLHLCLCLVIGLEVRFRLHAGPRYKEM